MCLRAMCEFSRIAKEQTDGETATSRLVALDSLFFFFANPPKSIRLRSQRDRRPEPSKVGARGPVSIEFATPPFKPSFLFPQREKRAGRPYVQGTVWSECPAPECSAFFGEEKKKSANEGKKEKEAIERKGDATFFSFRKKGKRSHREAIRDAATSSFGVASIP